MVAKFEIFEDEECNKLFTSLGTIDIGEEKKIPFFVANVGTTTIIDLELKYDFEDTRVEIKFPPTLSPGKVVKGYIIWKPLEKTNEGTKSGSLTLIGRSIGCIDADNTQ